MQGFTLGALNSEVITMEEQTPYQTIHPGSFEHGTSAPAQPPGSHPAEILARKYLRQIIHSPFIAYCPVSKEIAAQAIRIAANGTALTESAAWQSHGGGTHLDLTVTLARIAGGSVKEDVERSVALLEEMMNW